MGPGLGWGTECGVKAIERTSLMWTQPAWLLASNGWAIEPAWAGLPQEGSCSPCWGPQLLLVRRNRPAFSLPSFMIPRPGVGLCAAFLSASLGIPSQKDYRKGIG